MRLWWHFFLLFSFWGASNFLTSKKSVSSKLSTLLTFMCIIYSIQASIEPSIGIWWTWGDTLDMKSLKSINDTCCILISEISDNYCKILISYQYKYIQFLQQKQLQQKRKRTSKEFLLLIWHVDKEGANACMTIRMWSMHVAGPMTLWPCAMISITLWQTFYPF